jgi:hypothetical protein
MSQTPAPGKSTEKRDRFLALRMTAIRKVVQDTELPVLSRLLPDALPGTGRSTVPPGATKSVLLLLMSHSHGYNQRTARKLGSAPPPLG